MFGLRTKDEKQNQDSIGNVIQGENVLIRTMKDDLENLKNKSILSEPDTNIFPKNNDARNKEKFFFSEQKKDIPSNNQQQISAKESPFFQKNKTISVEKMSDENNLSKVIGSQYFKNSLDRSDYEAGDNNGKNDESLGKIKQINNKEESTEDFFRGNFFALGGIILTILVFLLGGYYFWITRENEKVSKIKEVDPVQTEAERQGGVVEIEKKEDRFYKDKPNYFRVDSGIKIEDLRYLMTETAKYVIEDGGESPIEFIVVDEKNSEIPFSVFALSADIKLPKKVIDGIENYSMYFYVDRGNARTALRMKIKEGLDISKDIAREEINLKLVSDFKEIFLEPAGVLPKNNFSVGSHRGIDIRYVNFNSESTLSLDHAFIGKDWYIGTSKDTIRAVLNKNYGWE